MVPCFFPPRMVKVLRSQNGCLEHVFILPVKKNKRIPLHTWMVRELPCFVGKKSKHYAIIIIYYIIIYYSEVCVIFMLDLSSIPEWILFFHIFSMKGASAGRSQSRPCTVQCTRRVSKVSRRIPPSGGEWVWPSQNHGMGMVASICLIYPYIYI